MNTVNYVVLNLGCPCVTIKRARSRTYFPSWESISRLLAVVMQASWKCRVIKCTDDLPMLRFDHSEGGGE